VCPAFCATREVLLFTKKAPLRGGAFANRYFVVIVVSALLCAPIHPNAWNRYSRKFAARRIRDGALRGSGLFAPLLVRNGTFAVL
jgi:hypothetical protein